MAVNCCAVPAATEAFDGVTAIDNNAGGMIVSVVEPVIPFEVTVMLEVPLVTAVAKPPATIVATAGTVEIHVEVPVRS